MLSLGSQRKPLIRADSGPSLRESGGIRGPAMRNWPLFVFLSALVFFFYIFYVYQAQSNDLSLTKEQLDLQIQQAKVLKDEIIDLRAALEKTRSSEAALKESSATANKNLEECSASLRTLKLKSDSLTDEKTRVDEEFKNRETELTAAKSKLSDLERNHSSLQQLYDSQQSLVQQLNSTIQILQGEVERAKAAPSVPAETLNQSVSTVDHSSPASSTSALVSPGQRAPVAEEGVGRKPSNLGEVLAPPADGNKPAQQIQAPDSRPQGDKVGAAERGDVGVIPGRPGDRVKMEEEAAEVAEQQKPLLPNGAEDVADSVGAKPAVKGGDYVDKDNEEELDGRKDFDDEKEAV